MFKFYPIIKPDTKVSGLLVITSERVKENKFGLMVPCMRAGGKLTKPMAEVGLSMLTVMFTMECGTMIKLTVKVLILILMVLNMMAIGKRTNNTDKVLKLGQMAQNTKVTTFMERRTAKVNSPGLMVQLTTVISKITTSKEEELIIGPMDVSLTVIGLTTKWKEKVSSSGLTEESTRENTSMTKKKVKELSIGPMAGSTKVAGKMESSMDRELTHPPKARLEWASGLMAKELLGILMEMVVKLLKPLDPDRSNEKPFNEFMNMGFWGFGDIATL